MDEPVKTRVLFFGVWNVDAASKDRTDAGHFMWSPGGGRPRHTDAVEYVTPSLHIDGTLAPRKWRSTYYGVGLCWQAGGGTLEERDRIRYNSEEYPEGQFLRHFLPNGFTAIQWWDRHQGDTRGACNSTVLLEGEHTTEEMLVALRQHFPHVVANLERAGISLVEVQKP